MAHDTTAALLDTIKQAWHLTTGTPVYILSPHLDDAIWSMGALLKLLADAGYDLHVVTIFSHTIFVYDKAEPPVEATQIRKAEDLRAAYAVGIHDMVYLDFPDGILRDTPYTGVLNSGYQTPPYFLEIVADTLKQALPANATVVAPLALGGHMDHLTTRRAALALDRPLVFFEDLPYAGREHDAAEEESFKASQGLRETRLPLSPELIDEHLAFYEMYSSQRADIDHDQIQAYLSGRGYSLWA